MTREVKSDGVNVLSTLQAVESQLAEQFGTSDVAEILREIAESENTTVNSLVIEGITRVIQSRIGEAESGATSQSKVASLPLTSNQAAAMLGMSRPTLIKLLERGDIPYHRVGRDRRIDSSDVYLYIERRRLEALQRSSAEVHL